MTTRSIVDSGFRARHSPMMSRLAVLVSFLTAFWITSQSALGQSAPTAKPVAPDPVPADPDPVPADPDPVPADPDPVDPVVAPPQLPTGQQTQKEPLHTPPGTSKTSPVSTAPSPRRFVPREERLRAAQPPGYHVHDSLFFRLALGVGYAQFVGDNPFRTTYKGGSRSGSVSLGFTVIPDVVVFGELSGISLNNPTISAGNVETSNTQISASGLGLGASYYLPSNIHMGASFIFSRIAGHLGENDIKSSDLGLVVHANAGKEFWVSDNWGLGLTLQLSGGSISGGSAGDKARLGIFGMTLLATATFN